jgi:hypothetical protein
VAGVFRILGGATKPGLSAVASDELGFEIRKFNVSELQGTLLPPPVLLALEDGLHVKVAAAARDAQHVCFARWPLMPRLGRQTWQPDDGGHRGVTEGLVRLGLSPTALIDAWHEAIALWALERPVTLTPETRAAAEARQRRLAIAVGASIENISPRFPGDERRDVCAHQLESWIPITGIVRGFNAPRAYRVEIPTFNPRHVYSLEQIERAIQECSA